MKRSRSGARRPADDSQDCSAGQPAYHTPHTTAEQRDNYCSIYASKPKAHPSPEYCAVCKQPCVYPFGPMKRPGDKVLVPTCGQRCYKMRWRLQGITIGPDGCEDMGNSAVRPDVAVRNTATHISSSDAKNAMVGDALILGQSLPPQCLLRLSAASRTLHRYATCDDVCIVFMHGSLVRDLFASLAPSISVVADLMPKTFIT